MSVEELGRRLDRRFACSWGSRTALPRHRTLRSRIDWSYDLLGEPEKLFLRRLSVFAGGWTLAAAEECAPARALSQGGPGPPDLAGRQEAGDGRSTDDGADPLPTTGDSAPVCARTVKEDSGGSAAVRGRHLDYYLALAEEADRN